MPAHRTASAFVVGVTATLFALAVPRDARA
jgi:hypothetical protein